MSKPILFMLIGLQASGKSTYACKLAEEYNAEIFSSDALREEMFSNINEQNKNAELFQELHKRIKECLKSGRNVIYDSTNISSKRRRSFLQELNKIDCDKCCFVMATPYEQCLANNASRDRKVPEEVIERTYKHFNVPWFFEGWDSIEVIYWGDSKGTMSVDEWLDNHMGYDQHNPHHYMTLGEHCAAVGGRFKEESLLYYVGCLHDVGKPKVMSFKNSKGESTESAHFYGHENSGAYEALFFDCGGFHPLCVSLLISLHMRPYYWEKNGGNEKLRNKYKNLWGIEIFNLVNALHEADKAAH